MPLIVCRHVFAGCQAGRRGALPAGGGGEEAAGRHDWQILHRYRGLACRLIAQNPAPRIGIRATVGLGKSAVSREQLRALQARLKRAGLPHRLLVFVPSLALADEAATGWATDGVRVAVHRGYEAKMPGLRQSMCQDLDMVRLAIASGQSVFPNACMRRGGARCHNFDLCAKQDNLRQTETADIIIAAYDNLFTGLSINTDNVALMVIDEGCWERAIKPSQLASRKSQ